MIIHSAKKCICIVLEYCKQGNLEGYQASLPTRTFELKQAVEILVDIMKGLRCIHEMKFIHRDIKPENILISRNKDGKYVYKIGDFGFARSILDSEASTPCGTKKFKAPEIHENAEYGISVDIWALGIVFYFMIFAEYPFQGISYLTEATTSFLTSSKNATHFVCEQCYATSKGSQGLPRMSMSSSGRCSW